MKKRLVKIGLGLIGPFLVIGITFCILRPAYVQEAFEILLNNELQIEDME